MPLTDYARNKIGDTLYRGQTPAFPTTLWFSLHTSTTPTALNEFTAVNGYGRIAVVPSLTSFKGTHGTTSGASTGTGGQFKNAAQVSFGSPGSAWSDAYGVAWWDAPSSGQMWEYGALTAAKACPAGTPVLFDIDALIQLIA